MHSSAEGTRGAGWTLITVTHNSSAVLRRCWSRADFGGAHWIVVDNASRDDSPDVARSMGAQVVRLEENVGFSAANNVGLELVRTPWTAFINPDVTITESGGLERLARVSEANDALVIPQLLNPDGSEQANARGLPYLSAKLAHRGMRLPGSHLEEYVRFGLDRPTYVAWGMGAAYGGPTELFLLLGGWDERFFTYYEDHDLGLRSWRSGHPVVIDPKVRWVHEWARETKRAAWAPWRRELRSASTFYSSYPELLRRSHSPAFDGVDSLWSAATDPDQ